MPSERLSSDLERRLFDEALDQPSGPERDAWLAGACRGDEALQQRLEILLRVADGEPDFLPSSQPAGVTPTSEYSGQRIGRYKLLQEIGEGGFGTVWMAEQVEPVMRRVAIKIIKLGMDTKEVIARFEQERQALAMMEHPNIAKVLDAGATETGRPYFVMELVRGTTITKYCDEHGLSMPERIGLFIQVCHAVQHAHQKGIIHRDLKPSNIVVTINDSEPVPKVIDFGVAKATQGRLTDGTLFTRFEQMVGTPLYMSPEQAALTSQDIDTRSDIYALGVLLYELLTGHTPIDGETMRLAGMDEMRRIIREVDPPRPSTRLRTLAGDELTITAQRRHVEPAKLPAALHGDLDWIVMKCLEKDRRRRYETANTLALDLQRHLADETISARPPTARYLLSKLIRRHRVAFAAGTAIAASLVIGIAASVWQAVRATRAERDQSSLRETAEKSLEETEKQRSTAEAAKKVVARQAEELNEELYATRLARAAEALSRRGRTQAQKELAFCDPQFRGWEWDYLHFNQLDRVLWNHPGQEAALFTLDGRHVIAIDRHPDGNSFLIRDAASGTLVSTITPGEHTILSPALSPDGRRIAFVEYGGNIVLWDISDLSASKQIWSVPPQWKPRFGMSFSRDGSKLAYAGRDELADAGRDGHLQLLRAADGVVQRDWQVPGLLPLRGPAFSPDGRRLTVARMAPDGSERGHPYREGIKVWDTVTGDEVVSLKDITTFVESITFSPDGNWIVTGGEDRCTRQWNASSGELVKTLTTHEGPVTSVCFSPDGQLLCSAGLDIQVREFKTGRLVHRLQSNLGESGNWLNFSPDGKKLVAMCSGTVVFDVSQGENRVLNHGEQTCYAVAFSADGRSIVSGGPGHPARIWDSATGKMLRAIPVDEGRCVAFSPDGLRIVSGGNGGALGLWNVADGSLVRRFKGPVGYVRSAAFSPDGRRVAATDDEGNLLRLWDAATGTLLNEFTGHAPLSPRIYAMAFSPDGSRIATGGGDKNVCIWDPDSKGPPLQTLEHRAEVTAVTFSPDGKTVAGGGPELNVRLWEVATGRLLSTLEGEHRATVWAVAFSPDGKRIATGDEAGAILIWNTANGRFLLKIDSTQESVWGLAWKPDGSTIASAGGDGTVRLWGITPPGQSGR
jgi:WD40 repeat protein/serine/threonine protein kinase